MEPVEPLFNITPNNVCPFLPNVLHAATKFSASKAPIVFNNPPPFKESILLLKLPTPININALSNINLLISSTSFGSAAKIYGFWVINGFIGVSATVNGYQVYSTVFTSASTSAPALSICSCNSLSNFATFNNSVCNSLTKTTSFIFVATTPGAFPNQVSTYPSPDFSCLYSGHGYIMFFLTSPSLTFNKPDILLNSAARLPPSSVCASTDTSLNTSKNISAFTDNTLNIFLIVGSKPITPSAVSANFAVNSVSVVVLFASSFVFLSS